MKNLFKDFSLIQQNSFFGLMIKKYIEQETQITSQLFSFLPSFSFLNFDSTKYKSDFFSKKSKYVLLEFWSSWCIPCRNEHPSLKYIFDKYHSKGFEILSISVDDNYNKWLKAISQDNIGSWFHGVDSNAILNNKMLLTEYLHITQYPTLILLDSNMKILYRDISLKILDEKLSKELSF